MMRVVHYGLGPIGAGIARLIAGRPDLQIVGAIDVDPDKVGRDVGLVIGLPNELGIQVSADAPGVLRATRPDVVILATGSELARVASQIRQAIAVGASVVSTCEELSYPFDTHPELAQELDRLARGQGVVVLGTGVNPGFAMDTLPLALTAVSQRVDAVRVRRRQDAARRRLPLQRKIGAGLAPAEFAEQARDGRVGHVGLLQSVQAIAHGLGWRLDRIEQEITPVLAAVETRTDALVIPAGHVLGVRQTARGVVGGRVLIALELEISIGAEDPRDQVVIEGLPRIDVVVNEGTHGDLATAAIVVNVMNHLRHVAPGLRIMADLPLVHYRSA